MDYFYSFTQIPLTAWLIIIGVSLGLLAVVALANRRGSGSNQITQLDSPVPKWKRTLFKTGKLTTFGLVSLFLITATLMLVLNYQQTIEETLPAPSRVEIPADLPIEVEEITFLSSDGLRIAGWFVPPQNHGIIILLHGYGANRLDMRWHAERLVEAGYGVLMYDERASGESEGEYRSFGWEDERDVSGALAYLSSRPEVDPAKIGICGCSIGGQIALQGAAYHPEIGAVWADGPAIIRAGDKLTPDNLIVWLVNLGNYMIDWNYQHLLGIEAPPAMVEIIGKIAPRPIMLVAGGIERPFLGNEARYAQHFADFAGENADVWVIDEAYHCDGPDKRPEEYAERMVAFFDAAFRLSSNK